MTLRPVIPAWLRDAAIVVAVVALAEWVAHTLTAAAGDQSSGVTDAVVLALASFPLVALVLWRRAGGAPSPSALPPTASRQAPARNAASPARWPHATIAGVLAALALVSLMSEYMGQRSASDVRDTSLLVNKAGRQRMLSMRLARGALEIDARGPSPERSAALLGLVDELETGAHVRIGTSGATVLDRLPGDVRSARAELIDAARALAHADPASVHARAADLDAAALRFLPRMDAATSAIEVDERARAVGLQEQALSRAGAVVLLAAIAYLFAVRPTIRMLESTHTAASSRADELARLALVAERTHNAVLISDAKGRATWTNRAHTELTGYTLGELLDRGPDRQSAPTDPRAAELVRAILAGKPCRVELLRTAKGGRRYWADLDLDPIRDASGEITGYICVEADVTALVEKRRALEESEARFRSFADASPVMMWISDARGRRVDFNRGWLEFRGVTREEELEAPVSDWVHADDVEARKETVERARSQRVGFELRYRRKRADGEYRWMHEVGVPRRTADGGFGGFVAASMDTTAQVEAAAELTRARDDAEAATRAKSQFLANMSHEIRTPMNGVLGMLQLMQLTSLSAEQAELVQTATSSGRALLVILNDILDFSKLDAERMALDPQPTAIRALLDDTSKTLSARAQDAGLELRVDVDAGLPSWVALDDGRLRQVLLNLLGNALKFTPRGGHVRLSAARVRDAGGDRVRLTVSDDGIGIPKEQQAHVFQAFAQADGSTTRKYGGTGLGLAISSELVRLMGGALALESEAGRGATFSFSLPLTACDAPADAALEGSVEPPSTRPRRVLLVEDNPVNQTLARVMLEKAGHEVVVAGDGAQAVALVGTRPFDVVLMDMQMPVMGGAEASRAIRASRATWGRIPIVALTASAMQGDKEACLAAGMDGFVTKPVDRVELVAAVERYGAMGLRASRPALAVSAEARARASGQ